jgi:hypothetical protein
MDSLLQDLRRDLRVELRLAPVPEKILHLRWHSAKVLNGVGREEASPLKARETETCNMDTRKKVQPQN